MKPPHTKGLSTGTLSLFLVLLITLISEVVSKSLKSNHHRGVHNQVTKDKKCFCKVIDEASGKVIFDYGELVTYSWPDSACHHSNHEKSIHHLCREECKAKLEIKDVNRSTHRRHSYSYCSAINKITSNKGVTLQAMWRVTNCPHGDKEHKSKKTSQLCCGNTVVGNKKIFGANPDCRAEQFVLSLPKP